ncbi:MAG: UxaA family hydrolase [Halanaerobiales bacterium]
MQKALIMNKNDNVAVLLKETLPGEKLEIKTNDKNIVVTVKQKISFGHKIAIKKISTGKKIIKYNEVIGKAISDIDTGEHVHIHNVESIRVKE